MEQIFEKNSKNKVVRGAKRAVYEKDKVFEILDSGFLCHISFVMNEQPFIIPTAYARMGDEIIIHGSNKSRMLEVLEKGGEACVCVTHLDGLVLARSAMHHSVNYRSVVVFGKAREITNFDEKNEALFKVMEQMLPGRWEEIRQPNEKELQVTKVLAIKIETASAKVRMGPPVDDKEDYELPYWAGVVPTYNNYKRPLSDPELPGIVEVPSSVKTLLNI
ncbi:pyridoxamine 5'-phosphate oxidase family protein [Flexithrix dorotheae]|uniref:pyridoxamine 5'-phosphate oxidase family protein n=1 Tax=Flexithrix dorotheae TaxID=70993 RepID=UPI000377DCC4|nr:pyridoxamine 5'-phosphate oxidase family protein [Flexithrix dorotheae]